MNAPHAALARWASKTLSAPSGQTIRTVVLLNATVIAVMMVLGRPLGEFKRAPLGVASVLGVVFSPEILATLASFLQLLVCGWVLWHVYRLRREQTRDQGWRGPAPLWLLMGAGFYFLALDEVAFIHEGIDKLIHLIFRIHETELTDRLDDLIPAVYALVGIGVLVHYRAELKRFQGFWPAISVGMLFLFVMVGLDVLTNRKDVLWQVFADPDVALFWWVRLSVAEEGCKLLAEAFFLGAFLRCHETARMTGVVEGEHILALPTAWRPEEETRGRSAA